MINQIISSKNRPAQLDLLLRSCSKQFGNINKTYILYNYTTEAFNDGYEKVFKIDYGLDIKWVYQEDYNKQFKEILYSMSDYVLFNSDDNVFIRDCNVLDMFENDVIAFSLRIGKGLNFCQPANSILHEPTYIENGKILKWEWNERKEMGGCYYPLPYDSNIYNKKFIYNYIKDMDFINPKTLEEKMHNNRMQFVDSKPYMMSFDKSCLINNVANETGQGNNLTHGNQSLEFLNNKWLQGYRLKLEPFENMEVTQCHVIKEYEFENITS